jgi:hypothetical protein
MARAHENASAQIPSSLLTHKPIEKEKIIRKSSYKAVINHSQSPSSVVLKENHHAVN